MICPYNRKSETQVLQWVQEEAVDATGSTQCQQITKTSFEMMECPKEGCAAWQEGKCRYAAYA